MADIKWVKPNDLEITTNDAKATVEHAESLGWKRVDEGNPISKMKAKELTKVIEDHGLDVSTDCKLGELRDAVEFALLEAEENSE